MKTKLSKTSSYRGVDERNGARDWHFLGGAGPVDGQTLSGCERSGGSGTAARADRAAIQGAGPGPPQDVAPPSPQDQDTYQDQAQATPPPTGPNQRQYTPLPPEQFSKLVAPIALYPDSLVAQILAASAYPTQIVEADRMVRENPELKGRDLAEEVDRQDWDPSVKVSCGVSHRAGELGQGFVVDL